MPWRTLKSCVIVASKASRPTPGIAKIRSRMMLPPNSAPICSPMMVTTGSMEFFSTWRKRTVRLARPFARAVTM